MDNLPRGEVLPAPGQDHGLGREDTVALLHGYSLHQRQEGPQVRQRGHAAEVLHAPGVHRLHGRVQGEDRGVPLAERERAVLDFQEMHDILPEEHKRERHPDLQEDFDNIKGGTPEEAPKDLPGCGLELIQVSYSIVLTLHIKKIKYQCLIAKP